MISKDFDLDFDTIVIVPVSSKVDEVSSKVELTQGSAVTDEPRAAASG